MDSFLNSCLLTWLREIGRLKRFAQEYNITLASAGLETTIFGLWIGVLGTLSTLDTGSSVSQTCSCDSLTNETLHSIRKLKLSLHKMF